MAVGPVDVYIIGFPGNKFSGEIAPAIMELVENGTIRVLDLLFVKKDADGSVTTLEAEDMDEEGAAFLSIEVAQPGALGEEDADEVSDDLPAEQLGHFDRLREPVGGEGRRCPPGRRRGHDRLDPDPGRGRRGRAHDKPRPPPNRDWKGHDMGLLRMAARTAVVAGTATAVSGRVQRRQAAKWDEQDAAAVRAAPPPPPAPAAEQDDAARSSRTWPSCIARACLPTRSSRPPRPRSSESEGRSARGP